MEYHSRRPRPRHRTPAADPLYTIGQVAKLTGLTLGTLRHWEKQLPGFLDPVRSNGNQRRYTDVCIEKLRRLSRFVRQEKMSLAGARQRIEEGSDTVGQEASLGQCILRDKRVKQAIEELASVVRSRLLEIIRE